MNVIATISVNKCLSSFCISERCIENSPMLVKLQVAVEKCKIQHCPKAYNVWPDKREGNVENGTKNAEIICS